MTFGTFEFFMGVLTYKWGCNMQAGRGYFQEENMNILLVYPQIPDTFWSFKHALKFIRRKASIPPLGLITVAAMLPAVWEKRLVDINVERLRQADLDWADYVFISAMAIQRKSAE
jgi:hypothetical protein